MRRILIAIKNLINIPYRLFCTHISPFAGLQDADVDKRAAICKGARFYRSKIGKYSYVGCNTFVTNAKIGAFSSIAGNCYVGGTSHPLDWVSTSSVFHKWQNILKKNFSRFEFEIFQETTIGNDVWIGEGCKIKAGVNIGDGAVVGMGSIVTHDIEPYAIYAGNPARKIRDRFDADTIAALEKSRWWDLSDDEIQNIAYTFDNVEKFKQVIADKE